MGLLLSHKRKMRFWNDMISVSGISDHEPSSGGKRGEVKIFSRASRYRMFKQLHQLAFEKVTFITLTYPDLFPTEPKIYKAHLKEWRRRFEENWGACQAIWRLEFQQRGAPHFHIMYLDLEFVDVHELCYLWKSVIHSYDMAHELIGVDLKLIVDAREEALIAFYLAKYIAKVDERSQDGDHARVGRWWGRWNISDPPYNEIETTDREAERVVTFALDCRVGGKGWEPLDPTICAVFGDKLGSGEYGQLMRRYAISVCGGDFGKLD